MQNKRCFKCRLSKPIEQYYKHKQMADGHLGKCKACTKKDVRRRYHDPEANARITAYERARAKDPKRRALALQYQHKRRQLFPGKNRARQAVNNAVRDRRLTKQPCQVCAELQVEAHHTDYRKPLDVQWLCHVHHLEAEGKVSRLTSNQ